MYSKEEFLKAFEGLCSTDVAKEGPPPTMSESYIQRRAAALEIKDEDLPTARIEDRILRLEGMVEALSDRLEENEVLTDQWLGIEVDKEEETAAD